MLHMEKFSEQELGPFIGPVAQVSRHPRSAEDRVGKLRGEVADANAALRRLGRIADAHHKHVDAYGGTWGECAECGEQWPCPTHAWATTDRDPLSTWDPADDATTATPAVPESVDEHPQAQISRLVASIAAVLDLCQVAEDACDSAGAWVAAATLRKALATTTPADGQAASDPWLRQGRPPARSGVLD